VFKAARFYLRKQVKSVEAAAARCDSNAAFVQAAVALCKGDPDLRARIVRGGLPLAEVPRRQRAVEVEFFGGRTWRPAVSSGGVAVEVARIRPRALAR
jgi:hypothetical protein